MYDYKKKKRQRYFKGNLAVLQLTNQSCLTFLRFCVIWKHHKIFFFVIMFSQDIKFSENL